jgi:mediator of RNA polymerase II transcription subunit 12
LANVLHQPSAWPIRLITEIPLSGLPEQVRVLRGTLLRGTLHSTEEEAQALNHAKDVVRQQAPSLFGMEFAVNVSFVDKLGNLSPSVQLELSIWLRQQVASNAEFVEQYVEPFLLLNETLKPYSVPTKDPNIEESGAVCRISPHDFHVVRSHVEAFSDLAILADIIGVVSTSLDPAVLTSAADTLHYHHKAFNAIGAFGPLFGKIAMRYAAIRTVRFPEREMILSLTDLARIGQADSQLVQLLAYDMSRYEQKNSLAACSPASDNMADFGLDTAMTTEEEIDRILSSGTSMDRQIISRVFGKIVQNLEEQINKASHQFENHPIWLYRLRGFDESTFEVILTEWLISLLLSNQVQLLSAVLPPLVSSSCMSLGTVLEIVKRCVSKRTASNPEEALRISIVGLDLLLPSEPLTRLCQPQDAYRYRIEQQKLCQDPEGRILEAIQRMIETASSQPYSSIQTQFMGMLSSDRLLNVVRHFAVRDIQLLLTTLGIGKPSTTQALRTYIKTLLDRLLDPPNHLRTLCRVHPF